MEKTMQNKLRTPDGTIVYYMNGKIHNWDGPAFIPEGKKKDAQYYLYGIRYTKEQHKEFKKDWNGLPWYKATGVQTRL